MFENLITFVAGLAIGCIIGKDYEIVLIFLLVLLDIVTFPFRMIYSLFDSISFSETSSTKKVVRLYDKIFITNNSKKIRRNYMKKINKINRKMNKREMAKLEKKAVKMLNEAKWVL